MEALWGGASPGDGAREGRAGAGHATSSRPSTPPDTMWRKRTVVPTNDSLIDELKEKEILTSPIVEAVMRKVDRGNYISTNPYADVPQQLGYNATISAPHIHAMALQMLEVTLREGGRRRALDVGAGSGYMTACMALLQGPEEKDSLVVGVEHLPELVSYALEAIRKDQPELLNNGRVRINYSDGRLGFPAEAPFDVIHVGAATLDDPLELEKQLVMGGSMVLPVGPIGNQWWYYVERATDGRFQRFKKMQVSFVPLTDARKQWSVADDPPPPPQPRKSRLEVRRRPSALLSAEDLAVIEARRDSDPDILPNPLVHQQVRPGEQSTTPSRGRIPARASDLSKPSSRVAVNKPPPRSTSSAGTSQTRSSSSAKDRTSSSKTGGGHK